MIQGRAEKGVYVLTYIISGRGRKSGGARATAATPNLAPLNISLKKGLIVDRTYF